MAYQSWETRPKWPIIFMVFRPRLVLLHVLDLADLTTNSSRDGEFVTDIFIGHRNMSKPIK